MKIFFYLKNIVKGKDVSNVDKEMQQNEFILLWIDYKDPTRLMTTTIIQNYYGG